ncbi:MAG: RNA polymerase-binding protein DksA [Dissulfuribacterales bacterium]
MDKEQLEYFLKLLLQKKEELAGAADQTIEEMTQLEENFPDMTDRASLETDRSFELRIRDRERKLLHKIDKAIERIQNGTYGICESCGEEIGFKRLEARPVTTLCIDCKAKQEREEKSRGG